MSFTIGVDVGGTKVAGVVVDEKGVILAQHRVETPARDAEATTTAITSVIQTMRDWPAPSARTSNDAL